MQNFKSLPKIDGHIHILPESVIAANRDVDDPYIQAGGIDEYVKLMDENHITKAVIMPFNDPFLMSMEFTVSAVHKNLMDFQKRYGDRFLLFADVDIRNSIEDTIAELRRVMETGAFCGIKLHPTNTEMPLDCRYFDEVFSYAEKNDIPVEVHCYPRENDPGDVCSPERLRRVLCRHPKLRLCAAHLGGFQYEALAGLDVWADISAVLPDMWERLGSEETKRALRMFPTDKIIFATDYPGSRNLNFYEIYPRYFEMLGQMDFSSDEIKAICCDNVLDFLKLR